MTDGNIQNLGHSQTKRNQFATPDYMTTLKIALKNVVAVLTA
jgi:hypothetical protein